MNGYSSDDLRAGLAQKRADLPHATGDVRPAQWIEFLSLPPSETGEHGTRTWLVRAANAVIAYSVGKAGDVLSRGRQPDEYAILLNPESAAIQVSAGSEQARVTEPGLVVVPPGESKVELLTDGTVVRLFSIEAHDLIERALNAQAYACPDPRCAQLQAWPDPVDGFRLRQYRLADYPISETRFGRIFRTTNLMINFLAEEAGPRDPRRLSPHEHFDFEQLSLALQGRFKHHIRYAWGPDSTQWRQDEHDEIATPSVCIIPPKTIHTTQGVGTYQQLIDIFSPPRADFSEAGWVLNGHDYPERGQQL